MCEALDERSENLWERLLRLPPMFQFARCTHSPPASVLAASRLATKTLALLPCEFPPPVSYQGYLSYIELDGMEITYIKHIQPITVTSLSLDIEYLIVSKEETLTTIKTLSFGESCRLPLSATEGVILFGVPKDCLRGASLNQHLVANLNITNYIQCCFKHLFKDLQIAHSYQASIIVLQGFQQRMLNILNDQYCHCPTICGQYPISESETPISLDIAIQFIQDQPGWSFSPQMLAKLSNTSERTIYYQFKHYTQTSPYRFHLRRRLFKAREQILSESGYDETIAYHAVNSGFFHLSRFSSLYKDIFGELPSETKAKRSLLATH